MRVASFSKRQTIVESSIAMRLWDAAGYLASGLVVIAFCMKDIIQLRVVALTSNIAFLIYGIRLMDGAFGKPRRAGKG